MKRLILVLAICLTLCVNVFGSSNEIRISIATADGSTDEFLYAVIFKVSDGEVFDESDGGNTFEVYNPANIANYNIPMTHNGGGYYSVSFDTSITDAGAYYVQIFDDASGDTTPVIATDTLIGGGDFRWDGTAEIGAAVDLTQIGGLSIAGNLATLTLKQFDVQNSAGDAVIFKSTGGNGDGMDIAGQGSGSGVFILGGSTGHGLYAHGGSTSGHGLYAIADGVGNGILAESDEGGNGIRALGSDQGGVGGAGFYAAAQANNDAGMELVKHGTGKDIDADEIDDAGSATGADAVWDETASDHETVDTTGALMRFLNNLFYTRRATK